MKLEGESQDCGFEAGTSPDCGIVRDGDGELNLWCATPGNGTCCASSVKGRETLKSAIERVFRLFCRNGRRLHRVTSPTPVRGENPPVRSVPPFYHRHLVGCPAWTPFTSPGNAAKRKMQGPRNEFRQTANPNLKLPGGRTEPLPRGDARARYGAVGPPLRPGPHVDENVPAGATRLGHATS